MQEGRLAEAKSQLLELIERDPACVEGYNLLAILDSQEHDYQGALEALRKALQLAPNSTTTHNNLGNVYLSQKKLDLAEREFRIVLRTAAGNRDANYNLGLLLMAKGLPTQAIPHFEQVRPRDRETQFNLIRAYLQSKLTAKGLHLATELSAENKGDLKLHFTLGILLAEEGQYKLAQRELEIADSLQPGTFEIVYNLGQTLLRSGDNLKAAVELNHALKLRPESPETLYLLAQSYNNQSRPLDALDFLVQANKISPDNPDILFLMAQISIAQKYFEDAIPLLERCLQLAPQRSDIRLALGESYFKADKVDKAIETLKKVTETAPSSRSHALLGLSYSFLGRFDEAKKEFDDGLKLEPNDPFCLFHLGYIAERQGDAASAQAIFQRVLRISPDFPYALLELANLEIEAKRLPAALQLLRKYVRVSNNPAPGYYKLAMLERSLHDTAAADQDLASFQVISKNIAPSSHLYEHLFDYLDNRSKLAPEAKAESDLSELIEENKKHPGQPEILYLLTEAYLKTGKVEEARAVAHQLDKASAGSARTLAGTGVLLARYRLYDDAIQRFKAALEVDPGSDAVRFDLADAYLHMGRYADALDAAGQVSEAERKDESYLSLLADIDAHLGRTTEAAEIFRSAIERNPDNDQDYLSLALLQFRANDLAEARQTLLKGQARVPGSGKILWGLGLASVMEGNTAEASKQFEHAVEMLPEWAGSYSTLGVFYFETGQLDKAKEVLDRFKNSGAQGGLDIGRIEQVLAQAPRASQGENAPMSADDRKRLLQFALFLADKTL